MKKKLDIDAINELKSIIEEYLSFASAEEDREMREMRECDAADLQTVLDFYREGKWKKAYAFARRMDTAPGENIPMSIWEAIS